MDGWRRCRGSLDRSLVLREAAVRARPWPAKNSQSPERRSRRRPRLLGHWSRDWFYLASGNLPLNRERCCYGARAPDSSARICSLDRYCSASGCSMNCRRLPATSASADLTLAGVV
jgi:hypothetical protein